MHKDYILGIFIACCKVVQNEKKSHRINQIQSDNGEEFEDTKFFELCTMRGYKYKFSTLKTPQQNRVLEKKDQALKDVARNIYD